MVFDDLATRLSAEYTLFLFALTGRYQQMRAPGVEINPRDIVELNHKTHELANTFYLIAARDIDNYLRPMLAEASESVADGLVVRKKEALAHIREMLIENMQQVLKLARTGVNGVGSLLKGSTGAVGLLVQRQAGQINFKASDTSGRQWGANKLLRVVARDFAYQAWIDYEADRYAKAGCDLMQTPKGHVFSLIETTGYESFEAIRPSAFHINSNEIMVPYVPS